MRTWTWLALALTGCNPITNVDETVPFRRLVREPLNATLGAVVKPDDLREGSSLAKRIESAWSSAGTQRTIVLDLVPAERSLLASDQPGNVTEIVLTRTSESLNLAKLAQIPVEAVVLEDSAPAVPEAPGWFDVGAGFGCAFNAVRRQKNDDVYGIFLSAKAYPGGRWYTHATRPVRNGNGEREVVTLATATGFEQFLRRWSVTYGFSLSDLGSEGVDGTVHHLGLGFDVSPDMALVAGCAFYHPDASASGGDQAFFLGVSLNLNAFRYMFSSKSSFISAAGLQPQQ